MGVVDYSTYLGGDGSDPVVSCSLEIAVPALLHFVYRYADHGVKTALLASTNAGGENVARGSPLALYSEHSMESMASLRLLELYITG